jgi:hypothetical protein
MVTDAAAVPAKAETSIPYGMRLLLTLALLALYVLGQRVPLPLIDPDVLSELTQYGDFGILVLGITPLITGFLLVELFSLMTSQGRRLRDDGVLGRAKLNRAALAASLLVGAAQAVGIASFLETFVSPGGAPMVPSPGWTFRLITVMTLTAATAALYVLGNAISEYGIGNGFALLLLVGIVRYFWWLGRTLGRSLEGDGVGVLPAAGFALLGVGVLAGWLFRHLRSAGAEQIPAFPQSVLPIQWMGTIMTLPPFLGISKVSRDPGVAEILLMLISIPVLSWLGFQFFSSRSRLEANLTELDEPLDHLAATLKRRLLPATALLILGSAAFVALGHYLPETFAAPRDFLNLIIALAIAFDLWDQFQIQRRHGTTVRLAQLDNVHFAYRLVTALRGEEIDALARALHLRSLYFFFGALVKIDVLVPEEDLEVAREVLAELEAAREVKVF